jgi:hypothetical protein
MAGCHPSHFVNEAGARIAAKRVLALIDRDFAP